MQTLFAGLRSNFISTTTLVAPTAAGRSSVPGSAAAMPGDACLTLAMPTDPCVAQPGDPCAPLGDDCVAERFQLADLAWSSSTPVWFAAIQGEG